MSKWLAPFVLLLVALASAEATAQDAAPATAGAALPSQHAASAPATPAEARAADAPADPKPANASTGTKPATEAKAAAASSPDDVICRNERETGSRMSRKVCRTRAEIEAQQREVEEMKRQTQAKGNQINKGG